MKYDFGLELEHDNTMVHLLPKIKKDSTVLEFGPAAGRMTEYMQKELNCKVSIVEIDSDGFEKAIKFAVDGICDNIDNQNWQKYFEGKTFDYIIFADVLEHLLTPEETLFSAKEFLNDKGEILLSIPNIAHDAVLIDLIHNRFKYRTLGIMDTTHVKFYTKESLYELFDLVNLEVLSEEAVLKPAFMTEFGNAYENLSYNQQLALEHRPYREVYQFVYTLKVKTEQEKTVKTSNLCIRRPMDTARVYVDTGQGFNEGQQVQKRVSQGKERIEITLEEYDGVQSLRFDPIDPACVVIVHKVFLGEDEIPVNSLEGNFTGSIDNLYVFLESDPQFIFYGLEHPSSITIEFEYEKNYQQPLLHHFVANEKTTLLQEIQSLEQKLREKESSYAMIQQKLASATKEQQRLTKQNQQQYNQLTEKQRENQQQYDQLTEKQRENEQQKQRLQYLKDHPFKSITKIILQKEI